MYGFNQELIRGVRQIGQNDPILAVVIKQYGPCTIMPHPNYYQELASSIISQQLSVKAAATIWRRFLSLYDGIMPTPAQILATDTESLRAVGVSYAKVRYIQDLALRIENKKLDLAHIATLDNQTILEQLTAVKGIGEWSAHMFMIFCLGRLNILPWGDLGIRKSAQQLYGLSTLPNKSELITLSDSHGWKPYESIAAWYLWQNLDNS